MKKTGMHARPGMDLQQAQACSRSLDFPVDELEENEEGDDRAGGIEGSADAKTGMGKSLCGYPARQSGRARLCLTPTGGGRSCRWLPRCEGTFDLISSNPALAYCLASNWVFHQPKVARPLRSAEA